MGMFVRCQTLLQVAVKYNTATSRHLTVMAAQRKGLVLGIYDGQKEGEISLTNASTSFQAKNSRLSELIQVSGLLEKKGKTRVFYGVNPDYSAIAVVNLDKQSPGYNELEEIDETRENIRVGVAAGVKQLADAGVQSVEVDPCGDPEAAAEGATLCTWKYDELKTDKKKKSVPPTLSVFNPESSDARVQDSWNRGVILAEGQNLARRLMETPANHMTPTKFAQLATEIIGAVDKVTVTVREREWAESMKMNSYLSVTNGSAQPPKFVEISYKGGKEGDAPFAMVGKGITFDSGGISLKPSAGMDAMRADMGGAACVVSSIYTAARLKLPINLVSLTPLCENMPGGKATKPGDVVTAMNGKTIQIDNTDAEGRLILADALCYAETFKPTGIIDMATLTGAMAVALGSSAAGVFSNSASLWEQLHKAGMNTGDRVWRMPLFRHYVKQMTESPLADLNNIGGGRMGGACTAAAFLSEFVTHKNWAHLDIAGVMDNKSEVSYLCKGMAGRPTRTIVEFLAGMSQQS